MVEDYPDPFAIAGVIKKILDKMPIPLIPFNLYKPMLEQFAGFNFFFFYYYLLKELNL